MKQKTQTMQQKIEHEPITFRLCADVKMSRPVDKDKDYICAGGYEMTMGGKSVQFDFDESYVSIDENDPSIIHIEHKNPSYNEYRDIRYMTKDMLKNVTEIKEFFIYTGEPDETDLMPVELIACSFILPYDDFHEIEIPKTICESTKLTCGLDDTENNAQED